MDLCCDIAPFERRYKRPCTRARAHADFSLSPFYFLWHEQEQRRLFLRFECTEGLSIQSVAFPGSHHNAALKRFILFLFPHHHRHPTSCSISAPLNTPTETRMKAEPPIGERRRQRPSQPLVVEGEKKKKK